MIELGNAMYLLHLQDPDTFMNKFDENEIKVILDKVCESTKSNFFPIKLEIVKKKNVKCSKDFRLKGNYFFNLTNKEASLDKALEIYTKSIAYSPPESQELTLAYANRSAVFFKANLLDDCLLDIKRALQNNYPDHLKAKLFLRKAMCLRAIDPDNKTEFEKAVTEARQWLNKMDKKNQKIIEEQLETYMLKNVEKIKLFQKHAKRGLIFELKNENPMIPGLSDAVELKYSKEFGRHIVAKRDIRPGEILGIQKPYADIPVDKMRYKLCWHCGCQTWSSVPCNNCVEVIFCSEKCREEGNKEHHDLECPVISSMANTDGFDTENFLALRIIVKAFSEAKNSFKTFRNNLEKIDAETDPLKKGFTNNVLDPKKFSSFYGMAENSNKFEALATLQSLAMSATIAYFLATETNFLGEKMIKNISILKNNEDFIFLIKVIRKVLCITWTNCFQSLMLNRYPIHTVKSSNVVVPSFSFFNHSCSDGVYVNFEDGKMTLFSRHPLKKNEQIFITYGPIYSLSEKSERQKKLLTSYRFLCNCEACSNNWPRVPIDYLNNKLNRSMRTILHNVNVRWQESKQKYVDNRLIEGEKDTSNITKEFYETIVHSIECLFKLFPKNDSLLDSMMDILDEVRFHSSDMFLRLDC